MPYRRLETETTTNHPIGYIMAAFAGFAMLGLIVAACTPVKQSTDLKTPNISNLKVVNIEGCEYLTVENGLPWANSYSFSICHKGNCTNSIHK